MTPKINKYPEWLVLHDNDPTIFYKMEYISEYSSCKYCKSGEIHSFVIAFDPYGNSILQSIFVCESCLEDRHSGYRSIPIDDFRRYRHTQFAEIRKSLSILYTLNSQVYKI